MHSGFIAVTEDTGRFDNNLNTQFFPGELRRVALRENLNLFAVHDQVCTIGADVAGKGAMNRIVFEQMGQGGGIGQVINGDNIQAVGLRNNPQHIAANTSKSVNRNFYRHSFPPWGQISERY